MCLLIDVVYIGLLNTQHFSACKLMLEHGKHILCEKPLCMNYKEAEKIILVNETFLIIKIVYNALYFMQKHLFCILFYLF